MVTRRVDQIDNIVFNEIINVDGAHLALGCHQFLDAEHLLQVLNRMVVRLAVEHVHFVRLAGIAQVNAHHKTIHLCLGQGERAFVFDWILRCQYQERPRHGMCDAIHCHLAFFHRFK
jgi:hypothetical protein